MKKEYTAKEAAEILGLSLNTVLYHIKKGNIKARIEAKIKQNYYYVPHEEIVRIKEMLEKRKKAHEM